MRHGGRPDPGEEWDARAVPYEERRGPVHERGRVLPGYEAYEYGAYEPYETLSYEPSGYDAPAHEPHIPYAQGGQAYQPDGGYGMADDTLTHGVMAVESAGSGGARYAEPGMDAAEEEAYGSSWEFEEGLARLLQTSAPERVEPRIPRQRFAHRRQPKRLTRAMRRLKQLVKAAGPISWLKVISLTLAAITAVVVAVVGALSGVISYDPLRELAVPGAMGALAGFWPLLVYGPWLVAAMSILRAAVHRRRAAHSWFVVVVFSAIAVYLCVAHAGRTPIRLAVAGLPPITALVCFHQLVRQITLTNPPRNGPRRPRHTARRD